MTIENADVIDGLGLRKDGSCVEMLISDHLEWGNAAHLSLLAAKVEAYADAFRSGQVTEAVPAAEGKPAVIRLVWKHQPDLEAARVFNLVQQQLAGAGIGFEAGPLPEGY
jgi:hypothetical protein